MSKLQKIESRAADPTVWPPPVYEESQTPEIDPLLAVGRFRSPTGIGRAAMAFFFVDMLLGVFTLTFSATGGWGSSFGLLILSAEVPLRLGVQIIGLIVLLFWINRAYANLKAFHVGGLSSTPAMAAGVWLVPGLSLYRPWQVVSELWKASDPAIRINPLRPTDWKQTYSSFLLIIWWGAWLARAFFTWVLAQALAYSPPLQLGVALSQIIVSILTMFIINEISSRQDQKYAVFCHETSIID